MQTFNPGVPFYIEHSLPQHYWAARVLFSLQKNYSADNVSHTPIYNAFLYPSGIPTPNPYLIGVTHFIEQRSEHHHFPILSISLVIHLTFTVPSPIYLHTRNAQHGCPHYLIAWSDFPDYTPFELRDSISELEAEPDEDLYKAIGVVDAIINDIQLHHRYPSHITSYPPPHNTNPLTTSITSPPEHQ